jgi:phosphoglucosamine mutase
MEKRKLFGTDGIRGKANIHPMTCEIAVSLGRAITHYFQETHISGRPIIVIGKDTRLSCYMLEQAISSGVCSQGGRAILTGPLPTPGVAFVTQSMRACAGIMISASHNPYSDNGIKIFDRSGHKLPDSVELELEKLVQHPDLLPRKLDGELGSAARLDEVIGRYIVHVKDAFNQLYTLDGLRLVVDCAHGASYKVAPMVFKELGANVIPLSIFPNGQNINLNCGALFPESCAEAVEQYRADLGICLDGDADRAIIIGHNGQIIAGDKLMGLFARFLSDNDGLGDNREIIGTHMCNMGLERYLADLKIKLIRTQVGDRYVVEEIRKRNVSYGGEPSGHHIFKKFSTTGDGILSALKVLECMKYYDKNLVDLVSDIRLFPQMIKNIKVSKRVHLDTVPAISKAIEDARKKLGDKGRLLVRYSGTEPLVRVMVEAESHETVELLCNKISEVITAELSA